MMKRKIYSTEEIVSALKQVDLGLPVADLERFSIILGHIRMR